MTIRQVLQITPVFVVAITTAGIVDGAETARIAEECGARVVSHPENLGNGAAVKSGMRAAKGDYWLLMDADGQHDPADIPRLLDGLDSKVKVILVDFHAEATSEKQALGVFLDGRATAVVGTHTHVPTADERVLPGGTAFISDVGMTGPYESVIGMRSDRVLRRFLLQSRSVFEVAKRDVRLAAVVIEADETTGNAQGIERLLISDG